jgi:hypothetical protein
MNEVNKQLLKENYSFILILLLQTTPSSFTVFCFHSDLLSKFPSSVTLATSGGRSVGIVSSRTKATELHE